MMLRDFFQRDGQLRALAAYAKFACGRDWSIPDMLKLHEAARKAFSPTAPPIEAFNTFEAAIYRTLKGSWLVFRNSSGYWTPRQVFDALRREFVEFAWEGPVTLPKFTSSGKAETLLTCLATLRDLKPNQGYPVMAVSKFLHFYNPRLFPIYDNEVVWEMVFRRFKPEFKEFCRTAKLPYDEGFTALFYTNYVCWAGSLLAGAHPQFMQDFVDWLDKQPGMKKPRRIDASTLYAMGFEFIAIGASQQPMAATVSTSR